MGGGQAAKRELRLKRGGNLKKDLSFDGFHQERERAGGRLKWMVEDGWTDGIVFIKRRLRPNPAGGGGTKVPIYALSTV